MNQTSEAKRNAAKESAMGNLLLFVFGCGVLAFFASVDRVDWLTIRPASGSSAAMAQAAARDMSDDRRAAVKAEEGSAKTQ